MILIDRHNPKIQIQGDAETIETDIGCAAAYLKEKLMDEGRDKEAAERFIMSAVITWFKCIDEEI